IDESRFGLLKGLAISSGGSSTISFQLTPTVSQILLKLSDLIALWSQNRPNVDSDTSAKSAHAFSLCTQPFWQRAVSTIPRPFCDALRVAAISVVAV
ncbi:MAG: hypothetical protein AAFW84_33025, partial [Cyanobacteria bacterium J06635_15]